MKESFNLIIVFLFFCAACCTQKSNPPAPTVSTNADTETSQRETNPEPNTIGTVSHRFRQSGCATVINVAVEGEENPLILIPREKLDDAFDVDGMEIIFNYHLLKMRNPPGCEQGVPAAISEVRKK